jgi:hypothetical protein
MMLIYAIAGFVLMFVAYLACDFYNEQLRTREIPVRADRKTAARKRHRE